MLFIPKRKQQVPFKGECFSCWNVKKQQTRSGIWLVQKVSSTSQFLCDIPNLEERKMTDLTKGWWVGEGWHYRLPDEIPASKELSPHTHSVYNNAHCLISCSTSSWLPCAASPDCHPPPSCLPQKPQAFWLLSHSQSPPHLSHLNGVSWHSCVQIRHWA